MKNRPVLAYRTALHRFSLAGCPEKDIYMDFSRIHYIIFLGVLQGALFLYPILPLRHRNSHTKGA